MAKLLVIGGSGFFGKSILDVYRRGLLEQWGITSIVIMARHASQLEISAPELICSSVELIDGDITSCNSLVDADYVIHAAASTDVRDYLSRPAEEKRNILLGTAHFCEIAPRYFQKSKIVYVSSGAVYGQQPTAIEKMAEHDRFEPLEGLALGKRDYAAAKRDAEELVQTLGARGLSVSIARCFAFVGPYLPLDQHFAIGNFIQNGMKGEPIQLNASQPVYRSYMYSDDLVFWLMTIAENASPNSPCFNVGSDQEISIMELANKIAKKFNVSVMHPNQNEGPIDRYIPSIEKAKRELDLNLGFTLDQAIDEAVKSLRVITNV